MLTKLTYIKEYVLHKNDCSQKEEKTILAQIDSKFNRRKISQ